MNTDPRPSIPTENPDAPFTTDPVIRPGNPDDEWAASPEELDISGLPGVTEGSRPAYHDPRRIECRRVFSTVGVAMIVLSCAILVGQVVLSIILGMLVPSAATAWWPNWVLSLVPLYAIGLPLVLYCLRTVSPAPHNPYCHIQGERVEKKKLSLKEGLILVSLSFGCMQIGSLIGNYIMNIASILSGYDYTNSLNTLVDTTPAYVTFIGVCIIAPFGEEFIFRKLLIDRTRRFGDTAAILTSGVLFGLFHSNIYQLFYATFLGIVLAYLYTRTGKYLLCVGLHSLVNLTGTFLLPTLSAYLPADENAVMSLSQTAAMLFLLLWIYGFMIATVVFLCTRTSKRQVSRAPRALVRSDVIANPGMLVALILMTLLTLAVFIPLG